MVFFTGRNTTRQIVSLQDFLIRLGKDFFVEETKRKARENTSGNAWEVGDITAAIYASMDRHPVEGAAREIWRSHDPFDVKQRIASMVKMILLDRGLFGSSLPMLLRKRDLERAIMERIGIQCLWYLVREPMFNKEGAIAYTRLIDLHDGLDLYHPFFPGVTQDLYDFIVRTVVAANKKNNSFHGLRMLFFIEMEEICDIQPGVPGKGLSAHGY